MNQFQVEGLFDQLAQARAIWEAQTQMNFGFVPYLFKLAGGSQYIGDLALKVGVTQQACGKIVKEMERRSLVTKVTDQDDGRARLVTLTPQGEALLKSVDWKQRPEAA